MGDGDPIGDCKLGHWTIDFKKNQKIPKKIGLSGTRLGRSPIRTRTDNPIKLSVRVPEPKKINISVWVPENSVRISGFWFGFSVSDLFEHPYRPCQNLQSQKCEQMKFILSLKEFGYNL